MRRRVGACCLVTGLLVGCHAVGGQAGGAPADGPRGAAASRDGSLVGWWHFNGCDGRVARDASGRGNDGAIAGGTLVRERGVTSLALDGIDGAVTIPIREGLGIGESMTAVAWVRLRTGGRYSVIFGRPHPNPKWTTPFLGAYEEGGRAIFGMWNAGGKKALVDSGPLPVGGWKFLAATYDGSAVRVFTNGVLAGEAPFDGAVASGDLPLYIGRGLSEERQPFRGSIGELRLYSRAMSAREVRGLFEETVRGYDLAVPVDLAARHGDGSVIVESCGSRPGGEWRQYPTRILELVKGYEARGAEVRLDRFGGWDGEGFGATGFFRAGRLGGRWWLIDPDGHRYLSIGINTVTPSRFAGEALREKFGAPERWAAETTSALRELGFNSKGSGGPKDIAVMRGVERPLPYTWLMGFMSSFGKEKGLTFAVSGHAGYSNECIPVFHPEFEGHCVRYASQLTNGGANADPYLLGVFSDNELLCPVNLLDRYLSLEGGNPHLQSGLEAAAAWLAGKRGGPGTNGITRRERLEFIGHAFERYYRIVSAAIRRYDTNHMYIGSRICFRESQIDNPYFWAAMGKHVDVATVNYYNVWGPDPVQVSNWCAWSGRPVIISEWYTKAMDAPGLANTNGAGWVVRTQEDRGKFYQHYALGLLEAPGCVGWHWFKYQDDPEESTALDCAGGANKGMFDSRFELHRPLADRARALNREAYPLTEFFDRRR